jgi:hypothetical protein
MLYAEAIIVTVIAISRIVAIMGETASSSFKTLFMPTGKEIKNRLKDFLCKNTFVNEAIETI